MIDVGLLVTALERFIETVIRDEHSSYNAETVRRFDAREALTEILEEILTNEKESDR